MPLQFIKEKLRNIQWIAVRQPCISQTGYNCAQSVAGAFADLTARRRSSLMAAMGGFGGGVGGVP